MKNKFTVIVFSFLFTFSLKGFAFDNSPTIVAQVLGDTIYVTDLEIDMRLLKEYKLSYPDLSEEDVLDKMRENKLTSIIWKRIIQKLSKEHELEPTAEEVESFTKAIHRFSSNSSSEKLTPEMKEASLKVNRKLVKTYKISKYLYETYGGTVIFQQGNPQEPVGAYRKLLEEYQAQGYFKIYNPKYEKAFWEYYLREHPMVTPEDKVDFSKPWWEKARDK
ncbi:hypothetical protein tinsulaeT_14630 [Thalassotalea insulae]|uniref:SurA-like protein n=1 Tax=Thalassotalea insulae TaxID=2056778 RepID=A0ABQ6GQ61_9GAMM|nr:SurA N-terminal domain-containing protein [Thalassotalea insulae]GLX78123.1 hypothetical protein tinsulaeT_14630 [Thalassotalea insulae]